MTNRGKKSTPKAKDFKEAGFRIRTIERKSGLVYQVDVGQRKGKHVRKSFRTIREARMYALRTRQELNARGHKSYDLDDRQRLESVEAIAMLADTGASLIDAATCYLKYHPKRTSKKTTLGNLARVYLDEKRQAVDRGDLRPDTLKDAEARLMRFINDCPEMQAIHLTADDVDQWLDAQSLKPINRANYKRAISIFLNWCIHNEHLDTNATKRTRKIRAAAKIPTLWTPAETASIFKAARTIDATAAQEFVPYLALTFFAGLRPDEAMRTDWRQIDLELAEIEIKPETSKTRRGRIVHMETNLVKWLLAYRKPEGRVFPYTDHERRSCRAAIVKATGLKWKSDAARHSFATYHLAKHNSIDQTVQELGHTSPQMLFQNYFGLAKNRTDQAEKYFQIEPKQTKTTAFKRA